MNNLIKHDILKYIENEDIKQLSELIYYKFDINSSVKDSGNTMLIEASFHDKENVVKFLLDNGADKSIANKYGITFSQIEFAKKAGEAMRKMYVKNNISLKE